VHYCWLQPIMSYQSSTGSRLPEHKDMVTGKNCRRMLAMSICRTELALASLLLILGTGSGCTKSAGGDAKKLSPNELVAQLAKSGVNVEKNGSFNNEPPAEMNMKLKLDGQDDQDFVAKRFPSPKLASDYCETQKACFTVEHWTIEAFPGADKSPQWKKLLAGAGHESKQNVTAQ
jgi:hypothetical protein